MPQMAGQVQNESCWSGCLGIIGIPLGLILLIVGISEIRSERRLAKDLARKAHFEHRYTDELQRLDNVFDVVFQRCTPEEKEAIDQAREYFHTKEESCRGDRDNDRQFAFNELETGIAEISRVADILKANPQFGPFEAGKQVTPFYLWSPEDAPIRKQSMEGQNLTPGLVKAPLETPIPSEVHPIADPADERRAFIRHSSQAAEGRVYPQVLLGFDYWYGRGTPTNHELAMHWLGIAAEAGAKEAKDFLRANTPPAK
jgi:hypothetical protein